MTNSALSPDLYGQRSTGHAGHDPMLRRISNSDKDLNTAKTTTTVSRCKMTVYNHNVATLSKKVLLENDKRVYLIIINNDAATDLYVNFGAPATRRDIKIIAGGNYEPPTAPIDSVNLYSDSGTINVTIAEGRAVD